MTAIQWVEISALTLRIAAIATLLALPPAVVVGYFLARRSFPGRSLAQAIIALPMVLPPVAVGLALLILLGPEGPLGGLLDALGIRIVFTEWAAALAAAVVGFPLFVRACEQSFESVDRRYADLARTLGHSRLQVFFRVTLPLARRGIFYGATLCFTRGLGEFGATALVAGIIPGRTETLSLGIWSRVQWGDDAGALALCAVSFTLALASMWAAETWLGRRKRS
jgi:molybdate transport system permease protein